MRRDQIGLPICHRKLPDCQVFGASLDNRFVKQGFLFSGHGRKQFLIVYREKLPLSCVIVRQALWLGFEEAGFLLRPAR